MYAGGAIETIVPRSTASGLGFAVEVGYFLSDTWSGTFEYSEIKFKDEGWSQSWKITAPAVFFDYHFIPQDQFDFYLSLGVGYSTILNNTNPSSFFYDPDNPELRSHLILPQGKIVLRYQLTPSLIIRGGLGFYRPLSFGIDYFF